MISKDHVGGWPKIMESEPERLHDIFEMQDDESDVPHAINYLAKNIFDNSKNIYAVFDAFLKFHDLGLYPPKWVLDNLAVRLRKHVKKPDPELLAAQLGVSGKGSGSTKPYDEYRWSLDRDPVLVDILILLRGFDITLTEAVRAAIAKYELEISENRIMTEVREHYGPKEAWLHRNYPEPYNDPFMLDPENGPREFLSGFPRKIADRIIRKRPPVKT